MDFMKVFTGFMFTFVIGFAFYGLFTLYNNSYSSLGGQTIDTGFYTGINQMQTDGGTLADSVGETIDTSGVSTSTTETTIAQSKGTLNIIGSMVTFIPNLFGTGATLLGIDPTYPRIAG